MSWRRRWPGRDSAVNGRGHADHDDQSGSECGLRQHRLSPEQQVRSRRGSRSPRKKWRWTEWALHGARKPSRERNLRGFSGRRKQQEQTDDHGLRAGEHMEGPLSNEAVPAQWCMAKTPTSNPMSQARYIANTRRPFSTGAVRCWKNRDQQYRSDADDLPSGDKQVERTCGECQQRSEREQMEQKKETEKTALAMQVGGRELPDQTRQHNRHDQERQRKPIRHEYQREMVIVHANQLPNVTTTAPVPVDASFQKTRPAPSTQAENVRASDPDDNAFCRNPAEQPQQRQHGKNHTRRQTPRKPDALRKDSLQAVSCA